MQAVIFAWWLGTRMWNIANEVPKPMIPILWVPILYRIIGHYIDSWVNDFIICWWYKCEVISSFFKWIWKNVLFESINEVQLDCGTYTVRIVNTWLDVWTAWRLRKVGKYLNEEFYLTYWDALSDINLNNLEKHYRKSKNSLVILTAVNPISNFWLLKIKGSLVTNFSEKEKDINSWINGGFFLVNKKCLDYIFNDDEMWEDILVKLSKEKKLIAYKHNDFWFCVDNKKDIINLEKLLNN